MAITKDYIQKLNASVAKLNRESSEARARKALLEENILASVQELKSSFGIDVVSLAKYGKFRALGAELVALRDAELEKVSAEAEQVASVVEAYEAGDYARVRQLLGAKGLEADSGSGDEASEDGDSKASEDGDAEAFEDASEDFDADDEPDDEPDDEAVDEATPTPSTPTQGTADEDDDDIFSLLDEDEVVVKPRTAKPTQSAKPVVSKTSVSKPSAKVSIPDDVETLDEAFDFDDDDDAPVKPAKPVKADPNDDVFDFSDLTGSSFTPRSKNN